MEAKGEQENRTEYGKAPFEKLKSGFAPLFGARKTSSLEDQLSGL